MLTSLAHEFARSRLKRHLLFLIAAISAIVVVGYHYGTFDQVVHIPFLKHGVNPDLYPDDPYLTLRAEHFSYFWYAFRPFYRLGVLEPAMLAAHVLATYLTFWMVWELAITLFESDLAAMLAVIAAFPPHIGLPGFPIIEFSLLNRTFVLPFLLYAMNLHLRGRTALSFLVLGTMYNLHVLSATYMAALLAFDMMVRWREVGLKTILSASAVFVAAALPVLLWKLGSGGIDITLRPYVLDVASRGILGSIYYLFMPQANILLSPINGLGSLALFLIGHFTARSAPHARPLLNFVIAVGIIIVVEQATTYWLPITIIVQMQILRVGVFLLILGYLYFAGALARAYESGELRGGIFATLAVIWAVTPTPLVPALLWRIRGWLAARRWRQIAAGAVVAVAMGIAMIGALREDLWEPGIYPYGPQRTAWVQAQVWARENTPTDTVFITPPQLYGFYTPDWRVFSERSTVVSIPELMETPFKPDYLPHWMARIEAVAPGAVSRFDYNYWHSQQMLAEAYYAQPTAALLQAARTYGADYLVVERPHLRDLPVAYENEGFVIYDLRGIETP